MSGHTVFGRIEKAADDAIAAEIAAQASTDMHAPVSAVVAGFSIVRAPNVEEQEKMLSRRQDIVSLHEARAQLRNDLSEKGLAPLAVLPANSWADIARKHGLFRFEHIKNGETSFGTTRFDRFLEKPRNQGFMFFGLWALCGLAIGQPLAAVGRLGTGVAMGAVLGFLATLFVCGGLIEFFTSSYFLRLLPQGLRASQVWPEGVDSPEGRSMSVRFPQPPQSFVEQLCKVQELGLVPCVASDPKAVTLDLAKFAADQRKRRIEARQRLSADPILYVRQTVNDHDLVAIIDQFGDFPNEKRLMKTLSEVNFLAYR